MRPALSIDPRFLTYVIRYAVLLCPIAVGADGPVVQSVRFLGGSPHVTLGTQAGQPYDVRILQQDVHAMWATGRFADIRVETTAQPGGDAVVFRVRETPALRLHTIRIDPHSFGLHPKLPEDMPINEIRAHEIAAEAQRRLESEGYRSAQVGYRFEHYSGDRVDLRLMVHAGDPVDIKEVEFRGDPGLDPRELRSTLRALRIRRVFPRVPGLWSGWRLFPAYSLEAVDADVDRLRSVYLSKGYFDAQVRALDAEITGKSAKVILDLRPGQRYQVREWSVSGDGVADTRVRPEAGRPYIGAFCSCLLAMRRNAERSGILDFTASLNVRRVEDASSAPAVDLAAVVDQGQPFRVGRIEFTGNRRYSDANVRRSFVLQEGAPFDQRLLRKSIQRLNQSAEFEPVDSSAIDIARHPQSGEADVTVRLAERKRRAWALSGPLGPVSLAGPLQASLSSRLPAWGRGLLELSTYTASISLLGPLKSISPLFALTTNRSFLPVFALSRPYTPGEGWTSGFAFAPQLGWQSVLLTYGTSQMQHRLLSVLAGDRENPEPLALAVERPKGPTALLCEPPKPRMAALRGTAAFGLRVMGGFLAPY